MLSVLSSTSTTAAPMNGDVLYPPCLSRVVHAQTDHERDVQHAVGELPHHGVERAQPARVVLQVLPGTQWFLWPPGAVR